MPVFKFKADFPPEIKKPINALLKVHGGIVPAWCHHVSIYFSVGGSNGLYNMHTSVEYAYRFASIYVYAGWIDSSDREHDLVHELFHIVTGPAIETAAQIIKKLAADLPEAARGIIIQSHVDAVESMTEDLTRQYLAGRLSFATK